MRKQCTLSCTLTSRHSLRVPHAWSPVPALGNPTHDRLSRVMFSTAPHTHASSAPPGHLTVPDVVPNLRVSFAQLFPRLTHPCSL